MMKSQPCLLTSTELARFDEIVKLQHQLNSALLLAPIALNSIRATD
jgi:hypothetical protein